MESAPLLNKISGIRVRLVRESDTARVQEIYMQAMLYGSSSPAYVALQSQPRKPFAFVLYGLCILGLLLSYPLPTRLAGVVVSLFSLISFVTWRQVIWLRFKEFCREAEKTDLSDLKEHYGTKPGAFWVAEVGEGKDAGTVVGCVGLDSVADKDPNTAEVKRMVVDPMYQNHGVGRLLIKVLLDHAKESGLSTITLSTSMFQPGAMHMYERCGFTKVKQVWVTIQVLGINLDKAYLQFFSLKL